MTGYITDGMRLFRVVAPFEDCECPCALLEDCFTLDVALYTSDELAAMRLRPVA